MDGFREFVLNEALLNPLKKKIINGFIRAAEYLGAQRPDPIVQTARKLGIVPKSQEQLYGELKKAQSVVGTIVWEIMRDMKRYADIRQNLSPEQTDQLITNEVIGKIRDKSKDNPDLAKALTTVNPERLMDAIDQAWEVRKTRLNQIKNAIAAGENVGEGFASEDGPIFPEELPKIIASTKGTITREADPARTGKWSGPQTPETQKYYTAKYRQQQKKLGGPPTIPMGPVTQPPESLATYKYYTPPEQTEEEPTILPFPKRKRR